MNKQKQLKEEIETLLKEIAEKTSNSERFEFWKYLAKMDKLLEEVKEDYVAGSVDKSATINGRIILEEGATIKPYTVIEGNAYISKYAEIGPFAYLRGNVIIARNCRIGRTEVKHSIILENSKASHFSYIGDSIVGRDVNFGAGTKLANLRFDNKNIKFLIRDKLVDSGQRKLGAIVCDDVKTGCNVTINCGSFVPKGTFILPNTFWKEK
ncbi:MAG: glucose-1-phosphate thymidylyltransferase [Candidatus Diapherotrites archaeon]|nr:glucose-1-phosphate thymidylyltransferase [Candidatus Diapherotrites archaeon]